MSKRPDNAQTEVADRRYCARLVDVAFPSRVWIGERAYGRDELLAALSAGENFRLRAARRLGIGPGRATDEKLVEKAFPATIEFEGQRYDPGQLLDALLASPTMRARLAEKYHYASDELYCERLVETAFNKGNNHESVRICLKRYKHEDVLRRELQAGSEGFREQVAKACGYPRSAWWLELYCRRLVELAFPAPVEVEGRFFHKDEFHKTLREDREFLQRIATIYSKDSELSSVDELLEKAFPSWVEIGDRFYSKDDLRTVLPSNPKLQQRLAATTYFTPSKWLVEQEMLARGVWNGNPASGDIYQIVADRALTGVCFSGGGIRSATFNLGVLQGFAQLGLLPHVDYLSSVSGGGYIHEFLAGWILRNGRQSKVIQELIPQAEPGCLPRAPEPIQWLKRYSSYLTPSRGIFSTDTWTAVAIWLRNTVLNQVPILTALACGIFLVHLLIPRPIEGWKYGYWHGPVLGAPGWLLSAFALALYAAYSVFVLCRNLYRQERRAAKDVGSVDDLLTNGGVVGKIILPWMACSVWLSYWVQMPSAHHGCPLWVPVVYLSLLILISVEGVIFAGGTQKAYRSLNPEAGWFRKGLAFAGFALGGLLATAFAVALGWMAMEATRWSSTALSQWVHVTLGAQYGAAALMIDAWRIRLAMLPGLLLSMPYVAIELTVGFLGRDYWSMRREWLSRLRAWSMLYALLWAGVLSLVFLGPYVGYYIKCKGLAWIWSAVITFVVSHGATVFAGWSGNADGKKTPNGFLGLKPLDLLALVAAPIAIVSLLLALSFAASIAVDKTAEVVRVQTCAGAAVSSLPCRLDHLTAGIPPPKEFIAADTLCLLSMLIVSVLLGWRIDVNEFSMHTFYKNRLSRCYLGATVPGTRQPDPFTGFDDRSCVKNADGRMREHPPRICDLLPRGYRTARGRDGNYDGPFPIFCATLNLTTGEDLATQERKGTSFAFTPLLTGYTMPWTDAQPHKRVSYNGFVPTEEYAYRNGGIHLDSAVAISGAALNPNQGYNSNPALAFLMTFFNVRLGWWISNPRKVDTWPASTGRSTPQFALVHLFKELFGKVGDGAKYVNLSDGGHFENMGLYELVRRQCRHIIVCDAEADPEMKFEGMGAAITKCRADFGAEIDLDLRPLRKQEETNYSKAHCVVGTIRYPPPKGQGAPAPVATTCCSMGDEGRDEYTGVIVYMKTSLVGDEPADLLAHQLKCAAFPQDSTANQWFTETLFEAYRRLGHHVAMTTIRPALAPLDTRVNGPQDVPQLFDRMYSIWYPRTPEMEKYLGDHLRQNQEILEELRERKELVGLEDRLNDSRRTDVLPTRKRPGSASGAADLPFVRWSAPLDPAGSDMYATQFAASLLNFMYTVYTNLQLAFPDNRVSPHAEWWICMFRRWCRVNLLQDTWATREAIYSEEFRLFAIRELGLP
jgi:hypothetical protein